MLSFDDYLFQQFGIQQPAPGFGKRVELGWIQLCKTSFIQDFILSYYGQQMNSRKQKIVDMANYENSRQIFGKWLSPNSRNNQTEKFD